MFLFIQGIFPKQETYNTFLKITQWLGYVMCPFLHGILVAVEDNFVLQCLVVVVAKSTDFY